MTISDYQVNIVLKTYIKNMKVKAGQIEKIPVQSGQEDKVDISSEGLKKMLYERIEEDLANKFPHFNSLVRAP